jgi:hypothetical protein
MLTFNLMYQKWLFEKLSEFLLMMKNRKLPTRSNSSIAFLFTSGNLNTYPRVQSMFVPGPQYSSSLILTTMQIHGHAGDRESLPHLS